MIPHRPEEEIERAQGRGESLENFLPQQWRVLILKRFREALPSLSHLPVAGGRPEAYNKYLMGVVISPRRGGCAVAAPLPLP